MGRGGLFLFLPSWTVFIWKFPINEQLGPAVAHQDRNTNGLLKSTSDTGLGCPRQHPGTERKTKQHRLTSLDFLRPVTPQSVPFLQVTEGIQHCEASCDFREKEQICKSGHFMIALSSRQSHNVNNIISTFVLKHQCSSHRMTCVNSNVLFNADFSLKEIKRL